MKKTMMAMAMATMVAMMAVTGCSKHESDLSEQQKAQEESVAAYMATMETGGRADKVPDPDAPVVFPLNIYSVKNGKAVSDMEDVEVLDADHIFSKMVEIGALPEDALLDSCKEDGDKIVLNLKGITADEAVAEAVAQTFGEALGKAAVEIQVDGETVYELENEVQEIGPGM